MYMFITMYNIMFKWITKNNLLISEKHNHHYSVSFQIYFDGNFVFCKQTYRSVNLKTEMDDSQMAKTFG